MVFFDTLMGPLGKEHCMIYYYSGIFAFFLAIAFVIIGLYSFINKKPRSVGFLYILYAFQMIVLYYLNRITYSICINSL